MEKIVVCVAIVAGMTACGSDDEPRGAAGASGSGGADAAAGSGGGGAGGSSGAAGAGASAGTAGSSGAAGAGGAAGAPSCALSDVQITVDETGYQVQRFRYESSGGLSIAGELCRPKTSPGAIVPTLIWNHGGWVGLTQTDRNICQEFAKNFGWAVFMSEYRGEGSSDGSVELCLGEVDDVLELTSCAAAQPWVDASRMLMAGASHGGCITLRSIQRGAPVVAAADVFGPTDFKVAHAFWKATLDADPQGPSASAYQQLLSVVETATGGTPDTAGAAYDARSPAYFAADLPAYPGDLLIVHGVADPLVPAAQSCKIAGLAGGFAARHYEASATTLLTTPPVGCAGSGLVWLGTPPPSSWSGARHLIVYDGAGHDLDTSVPSQAAMAQAVVTFLVAKL